MEYTTEEVWAQASATYQNALSLAAHSPSEFVDLLERATLLFAAWYAALPEDTLPSANTIAYANALRHYGEVLMHAERYPEAARTYQRATDLFNLLGDSAAHQCSKCVVQCVTILRRHPEQRLDLLIAHYERMIQELEIQNNSDEQQAECRLHLARILMRRDRAPNALTHLGAALKLYDQCEPNLAQQYRRAECQRRIGEVLWKLNRRKEAVPYYQNALRLYEQFEGDEVLDLQYGCREALRHLNAEP